MDSIQQDPYDHRDGQDAAEAHYLRKADRDRDCRRREAARRAQQQQSTFLTAPPAYQASSTANTTMQQGSISAAQAATRRLAEMERAPRGRDARPRREQAPSQASSSRRQQSPRVGPLPQATYSPFPSPAPVQRRPVANQSASRPRNPSPSPTRAGSADSVLSFVSTTAEARPSQPRDGPTQPPSQPFHPARRKPVFPPLPPPKSPSGSTFFKKLSFSGKSPSRSGSASSNTSQASTRSRPSTPSRFRRASNDLAKNLTLLTLPASSRTTFLSEQAAAREEELEQTRKENPYLRPRFQRDFLEWRARKAGIWNDDKGVEDLVGMSMSSEERRVAIQAALQGRGRGGDVRWSAEEEVDRLKKSGRLQHQTQTPASNGGGLTASEEIAMFIARGLDPLRRKEGGGKGGKGRQGSDDSGMDFADCGAPPDVMENCQRCGRPVGGSESEGLFLKGGLCPRCYRGRGDLASSSASRFLSVSSDEGPDEEDLEDDLTSDYSGARDRKVSHPFSISSFSDSSSSESGDNVVGGRLDANPTMSPTDLGVYIKISATRKIGRLRNTVYSDPGNPFDDEPDDATPIAEKAAPFVESAVPTRCVTPPPPAGFWRNSWSCQTRSSRRKGFLKVDTQERRSHEDGKKVQKFRRNEVAACSSSSFDEYDNVAPPSAFWKGRSVSKNRKRSGTPVATLELGGRNELPERNHQKWQGNALRQAEAESQAPAEDVLLRDRRSDPEDGNKTPILSPTPRRSGTPTLIREHSFPICAEGGFEDKMSKNEEGSEDVNRDTRFYKFYSGVLGEYVEG